VLEIEILDPGQVDRAAALFHRDGLIAVKNALTPKQFAFAQAGARREIALQLAEMPRQMGNRGLARYSLGPERGPGWIACRAKGRQGGNPVKSQPRGVPCTSP